jgi:hypothetical protein
MLADGATIIRTPMGPGMEYNVGHAEYSMHNEFNPDVPKKKKLHESPHNAKHASAVVTFADVLTMFPSGHIKPPVAISMLPG